MSDHPDGFAEFTEELRLLAEVLLARVEPVLRRTAADGQADLGGCAWCPVCAAAALVRGDHHDVVAALADHGTAMVTVLREALAGVPVDPLLPPEWFEHAAGHPNPAADRRTTDTAGAGPDTTADTGAGRTEAAAAQSSTDRARPRWGSARRDPDRTPRPRRVDEYPGARQQGAPTRTPPVPPVSPSTGPTDNAAGTTDFGTAAREDTRRRTRRTDYVDIPVTIRG
ncbi:hypothetical protein ACFXK0_21890 [Nocardia sp. NPDC059177]|uniref:hypothetical protein n=1 Tax=Nocardia sp. NPDC059177 TaxID=3346759 RepID=UPI00369D0459